MKKTILALFLALAMLFVAPVASLANRVEARESTLPIEKEYVAEQNGQWLLS